MAKIQVQGIGMFTDDTLKKKIIQLANDLQKNAKKGNWNKASENGIRALGRMWGAYQDWSRQNEAVSEAIKKWKDVPKKGTLDFGKYGKYVILSKNKMRISGKFVSGSNKGKSVKWYSDDGKKDARKRKGLSISDTPSFPFGMVKEDMKNTSKVMKAVRKGPKVGPWNIIVSKNNNIVKRVLVKNLKEIPAEMSDLRDKYPNHIIGIESKAGKIVYREGNKNG